MRSAPRSRRRSLNAGHAAGRNRPAAFRSRSVLVDRLRARARAGPCRALATTLGRDGRIPQPGLVTAIDHPVDLRAIDADIAQRAVVERAQLARRRLALAA